MPSSVNKIVIPVELQPSRIEETMRTKVAPRAVKALSDKQIQDLINLIGEEGEGFTLVFKEQFKQGKRAMEAITKVRRKTRAERGLPSEEDLPEPTSLKDLAFEVKVGEIHPKKLKTVLQRQKEAFKRYNESIKNFTNLTQLINIEDLLAADPTKSTSRGKFLTRDMRLELEKRAAKLRAGIQKSEFEALKAEMVGKGPDERLALIDQYLKTTLIGSKKVDAEIRKAQKQKIAQIDAGYKKATADIKGVMKEQYQDVLTEGKGKTFREQIHDLREHIKAGGSNVPEARARIRELLDKERKALNKARKDKFERTRKHILGEEDIDRQVNFWETYLSNPRARFREEAEAMLAQAKRIRLNAQRFNAKAAQRRFASNVMIGASAGLGLLGPAGFPLLNVGFAAMSGGVVGAGVAAASTGIGELTRALNTLQDSSIAAAKEIGFVSMGFKLAEARMKGLEAFIGAGALTAEQVSLEERYAKMRKLGAVGVRLNADWKSFKGTSKNIFWEELTGEGTSIVERAFGPHALLGAFGNRYFKSALRTQTELLPNLLESRRSMMTQLMAGMPGVENDPYQVWLRMQNAALDVAKSEEMRVRLEEIKAINNLIKEFQEDRSFVNRMFAGQVGVGESALAGAKLGWRLGGLPTF